MIAFHPFADIFDMLTPDDAKALAGDIRKNGLRDRIIIFEDKILDGRNRYVASIAAGLLSADDEPDDRPSLFERFVPDVDGDPLNFVISKNVHRRHLTIGQRAYAMAEAETLRHGGVRKVPAPAADQDANLRVETRADLAERAHVSERSIASAAAVRDHGVPELQTAVKQAVIPISKAEQIARLPEPEQREELERALPNADRAIAPRRQEPSDSLDFFPTPPWATRALIDVVMPELMVHKLGTAWEPACGEGHIAEVLTEYFDGVLATDVHDYGYGVHLFDFLEGDLTDIPRCDWIITNPPFDDKAEKFVMRALSHANVGVAMFLRLQWLEGQGRYDRIFKPHPPTLIAQFAERVPLHKGRYEPDGATLTAYLWMIWMPHSVGRRGTRMFWIPPGQKTNLTRPDDADRFTAHPVIRRSEFDPVTGKISPYPTAPMIAPEPAHTQCQPESSLPQHVAAAGDVEPAPVAPSPPVGAGSFLPAPTDDELEIPAFLRRPPKAAEQVAAE